MPLSLFHLHGDLKDLRFPRLLAALRHDRFTGVFQATTRSAEPEDAEPVEATREVHFTTGRIAWAISTDKEESLRSYLVRHGTVTESRWAEAEDRAREGTLRQALIEMGMVDPRELTQLEKGRAEEIVLALFSAREGEYRVRERQLSPGTPDLGIDPRPLILKGVLEGGDRALAMDEVGSLDTVYVVKRSSLDEQGLSLSGEFQSVLRHIDGKRSIAQICAITSLPDNFVCSLIAALSMTGSVRRNYEKSQSRPRGEIVKGIEVSVPGAAAPAAPARAASAPPAAPVALSAAASTDASQIDASPAGAVAQAPDVPQPSASMEPPISRRPFPGEGPITPLPVAAQDMEETEGAVEADLFELEEDDEMVLEAESAGSPASAPPASAPAVSARPIAAPLIAARRAAENVNRLGMPAYGESARPENSRPWFLLGGAVAVGFAALFLILMAQNPGDAGVVVRPVSEAAPEPAALGSAGGPSPTEQRGEEPDVADEPDEADDPPKNAGSPVAPAGTASILSQAPPRREEGVGPARPSGRESLMSGDYRAAARYFGREASQGAGLYTIQLVTACKDETIRRAVESAHGSTDLFILSTRLDGRDCYRIFWGRYPTATRAREALRREVPSSFLQDRNQPRVSRLGS